MLYICVNVQVIAYISFHHPCSWIYLLTKSIQFYKYYNRHKNVTVPSCGDNRIPKFHETHLLF